LCAISLARSLARSWLIAIDVLVLCAGFSRRKLELQMAERGLVEEEQERYRKRLHQKESEYMRLRRVRLSGKAFESIKIIGRGAFGEVRLVRLISSGDLFAMKKLKKSEMIRKDQVRRARAHRREAAWSRWASR